MMKVSVNYLNSQNEGWDLASDSAYQVQTQSFDGRDVFIQCTIIQLNMHRYSGTLERHSCR